MTSRYETHSIRRPTGAARMLAIIGDPIRQVKSPEVFADYFAAHEIDAVMVPLHVPPEHLDSVLAGLARVNNCAGAVVTIPHKQQARRIASECGPMARRCHSANALAPLGDGRWSAEMFDGIGLLAALRQRSIATAGLRVLLIGAGGAGTAIAFALQDLGGAGAIDIADPDERRAGSLSARLQQSSVTRADPEGYQLVVNASPVGMGTDESPLPCARLAPGTIVCDAVMDPPRTRLLREAEERGCIVVAGLDMLRGQVEPLAGFFGLTVAAP